MTKKTVLNPFFNINSYSYMPWLYVQGILGQNSKNCILGVIARNLEKWITVGCEAESLMGHPLSFPHGRRPLKQTN